MMARVVRGPELGPGERAERARSRKLKLVFGLLALAGGITGGIIGYAEGREGFMQGTIPGPVAAGLAALFLLAMAVAWPILRRNMDEQQEAEHMRFMSWGALTYLLVYPIWFLLWKGELAPEPHHLVLFGLFYLGGTVGYTAFRFWTRRPVQGE